MDDDDDDWVGSVDARGRPHGRGTLRLGKRSRFEGRMHHGGRRGMGTLYVDEASDDDEGDGAMSRLHVPWLDDAPHGRGVFTEPDGAELRGTWADGALEGCVRELHASGALRFVGGYAGGVRHGEGIELREDGGCLTGTWVEGELHGTRCAYLYPCARGGALVGSWERGTMRRASYQLLGAAAEEEEVGDEAGTETGAGGTEGGDAEGGGGGGGSGGGAGAGGGSGGLEVVPPAAVVHPWVARLVRAAAARHPASAALLPRRDPREPAVSFEGEGGGGEGGAGAGAGSGAGSGVGAGASAGTAAAALGGVAARRSARRLEAEQHEATRVRVAPSGVPGSGLGLWARATLAPGEVAAFILPLTHPPY